MNKLVLMSVFGLMVAAANASEHAEWTYEGEAGPENWAKLTPEYDACAGQNQSPVNLTGFIEAELTPISFNYQAGGEEVINNGHTIQVNYASGSGIEVDGIEFALKQFHFHAPSENHIDGKSYPLEGHLVHASDDGQLAVVAVMFEEGDANAGLEQAWSAMPKDSGGHAKLEETVDVASILPENRDHYRFNGSLTTPPCSEGVRWLVMKDTMTASQEQIAQFTEIMHHANNRPIQALNARQVLQ